MLILKRPWTSQPQTAVGVDWGNPLARGIVGAWLPQGINLYDASGIIGSLSGTNTARSISSQGVGHTLNGSSSYLTKTDQSAITDIPLTLSIWTYITSAATKRVFDISTGTTANDVIGIQTDASSRAVAQHYDGSTNSAATWGTITDFDVTDRWAHIVAVFESLSSRKIYIDGVLAGSNTTAVLAPSGINRVTIGYAPWAGAEFLGGNVLAPMMWKRALSAPEVQEVYVNPWQLFQPRRIYIPTAGAAATAPSITALSAINITATSAQPRISYS